MYCSNCGTRNEGNKFCTNCGTRLDYYNNVNSSNEVKKEEKNGLKTASIVLGIIGIVSSIMIVFSPIGIILSMIGLIFGIIATKKVRNALGIVLNSVGLFLSIAVIALLVWFFVLIVNDNNDYVENDYYYEDNYDDYDYGNFNEFFDEYLNDSQEKEYY